MEKDTLSDSAWIKGISAIFGSRNPLLVAPATAILLFTLLFNVSTAGTYFYGWDIVPYIGVVYSMTEDSIEAAHGRTYAEIKSRVSPSKYKYLIGEGAGQTQFLSDVARDPESFAQQLPFYSVKPLYPLLIYALNRLGVNVVTASLLISQIAYLMIGGLLLYWLKRYYPILPATLLTMLLVSMPFILSLATFSGPDALSTFMILLALYIYIETPHTKTALLVLLISIAARPENLILIGLLMASSFIFRKETRLLAIGTVAAGLGIYLSQVGISGNYGWKILFYHSFVQFLSYPLSDPVSLSVGDYLRILAARSRPAEMINTSYSFISFILLSIVVLQLQFRQRLENDRRLEALGVSLLFSVAHWLIFPGQKERYLAAFFLLAIVSLLICAREAGRSGGHTSVGA